MNTRTFQPDAFLDACGAGLQRLLAGVLCLLLGACASAPQAAHAHAQATHARSRAVLPGPGGAVPPDAAQHGGYYLDDGPGDGPPQNPTGVPDAVPRDEAILPNANRPYEALGEVYFPDTSSEPYSERGLASWYGRRFHGHRTSSGETYDMYAMTGAHKTLPIPSYARVTDVLSGRSIVVRINDRGPFHPGRVIDLSYTAAAKLGFAGRGSAEVVVERVFPAGLSDLPGVAQDAPAASPAGAPSASAVASAAAPAHLPLTLPGPGMVTPVAPPHGASVPTPAVTAARSTPAWLPGADAGSPSAPTAPEDSVVAADSPPPELSAAAAATGSRGLFLQLGAFRNAANARQLLARARSALRGLQSFIKLEAVGGLNRVRLGPFPSAKAQNAAAGLVERALNLKPGIIGP